MTAPADKGPSWWYLALAPLILAVGLGVAIWCIANFVMAVSNGPTRFDGPGEYQTAFGKPGRYAIFQEYPDKQSPVFDGSPERPYPVCTVVSADGQRNVKIGYAKETSTQTINERSFSPIFEFEIDRPGAYRIISRRADGADKPKFILGVGPPVNVAGPMVSMFICPVVGCGSIALAAVVVIVFLVLRGTTPRAPSYPAATPFPPPSVPPIERPPASPEPDK